MDQLLKETLALIQERKMQRRMMKLLGFKIKMNRRQYRKLDRILHARGKSHEDWRKIETIYGDVDMTVDVMNVRPKTKRCSLTGDVLRAHT